MGDHGTEKLTGSIERVATRPLLFLVHGTGGSSAVGANEHASSTNSEDHLQIDEPRWWQDGSRFNQWLYDRIEVEQGGALDDTSVVRFVWSGLNSEKAREEAAVDLATLMRPLALEGHSIHLLAHSHGGNVVRRAIELSAHGREAFAMKIKSVTAFGTPFFHYSARARLFAAAFAFLIMAGIGSLTLLAVQTAKIAQSENLQIMLVVVCVMLGGSLFWVTISALIKMFRMAPFRQNRMPHLAAGIDFCNLYAGKDEAISLLMSFNEIIILMQRADFIQVWMKGPLGVGWLAVVALSFAGGVAGTWDALGGTFMGIFDGVWPFVVTIIAVAICIAVGLVGTLVLNAILMLILTVPIRLSALALDFLITKQLKKIAYGSDAGNGMVSVQLYPWENTEHYAQPLPRSIDDAIELHISERSGKLWANIRSGLSSGVPFSDQDLTTLVQRALTWDELSHTVYYQVEAFADLVANRLVETGDWRAKVPRIENGDVESILRALLDNARKPN